MGTRAFVISIVAATATVTSVVGYLLHPVVAPAMPASKIGPSAHYAAATLPGCAGQSMMIAVANGADDTINKIIARQGTRPANTRQAIQCAKQMSPEQLAALLMRTSMGMDCTAGHCKAGFIVK